MYVIYTDLDGTLLDRYSYSFSAAATALETAREKGIPVVFCTSKTRAEVEAWRKRIGIDAPFIVENGGAIYIPRGYFSFPPPDCRERGGYDVVEFGDDYLDLVGVLETASKESGCRTLGFHAMSTAEIALRTHMRISDAELARMREYDEPFEILDAGTHRLLQAIESRGKRWNRGGRFYHITGNNDKAMAVRRLTALFREADPGVLTIGAGDAWNDVAFLNAVDFPVLIRTETVDAIWKEVPRGIITDSPGPAGWNEAVLRIIGAEAHPGFKAHPQKKPMLLFHP